MSYLIYLPKIISVSFRCLKFMFDYSCNTVYYFLYNYSMRCIVPSKILYNDDYVKEKHFEEFNDI